MSLALMSCGRPSRPKRGAFFVTLDTVELVKSIKHTSCRSRDYPFSRVILRYNLLRQLNLFFELAIPTPFPEVFVRVVCICTYVSVVFHVRSLVMIIHALSSSYWNILSRSTNAFRDKISTMRLCAHVRAHTADHRRRVLLLLLLILLPRRFYTRVYYIGFFFSFIIKN